MKATHLRILLSKHSLRLECTFHDFCWKSELLQAPDLFAAAAVRNPVCNLALMVGTSDIPDWCFIETYGSEGISRFTEAPSSENLSVFYSKSPISHLSKVSF